LGCGKAGQQHKQNNNCQTTAQSETWGNHLSPRFPGLARISFWNWRPAIVTLKREGYDIWYLEAATVAELI
jgi:hypothetical protein